MAMFRKLFYRKPPDGLLEICERVFVFDSCFTTNALEEKDYKGYVGKIISQLKEHYPDAAILAFNFREGDKQSNVAKALTEYDTTVMEYPRQYEGCPLLSMEMIHHFLRSSESWISLGLQNVLFMHCEPGGWPILAFMLAALLIYRKYYTGEHRTLDMIYKQAPRELLQLFSHLNPIPSQLRYLQYVSRRNVSQEWPPLVSALAMDCVIIRAIPNFDGQGGCRPILRVCGQDPSQVSEPAPKVLFSTPHRSTTIRHYKQAECGVVKIDINCHIQGDVVMECINLHVDTNREQMMFRVMFNTAFIRSNILILGRDDIDILWDAKDLYPKDFRAEVLFSDMDAAGSIFPMHYSCFEEKDNLPVEAFAKVHEIFNVVDWLHPKGDMAVEDIQKSTPTMAIEAHDKSQVNKSADTRWLDNSPMVLTSGDERNLSQTVSSTADEGTKQSDAHHVPSETADAITTKKTLVHPGDHSPSKQQSDPNASVVKDVFPNSESHTTIPSTHRSQPTKDSGVGIRLPLEDKRGIESEVPSLQSSHKEIPESSKSPLKDGNKIRMGISSASAETSRSHDDSIRAESSEQKIPSATSSTKYAETGRAVTSSTLSSPHTSSTEYVGIQGGDGTPPANISFPTTGATHETTPQTLPAPLPQDSSTSKPTSHQLPASTPVPPHEVLPIRAEAFTPSRQGTPPISPLKEHSASKVEPSPPSTPPLQDNTITKHESSPPSPPSKPIKEMCVTEPSYHPPPSHRYHECTPPPLPPPPVDPHLRHAPDIKASLTPPPLPLVETHTERSIIGGPSPPPPSVAPSQKSSAGGPSSLPSPEAPKERHSVGGPPPSPPPPPAPLVETLKESCSVEGSPPAPPPPPPPPEAPKEWYSVGGPPPQTPPSGLGVGSKTPPTLLPPPPPPPPTRANLHGSTTTTSPSIPSAPPPPIPSTKKVGSLPGAPSPPPPLIPPPGTSGKNSLSRITKSRDDQTKKLKPLHWLKISRAVSGSLWAEAQKSGEASKAPEIDISELESLFSAPLPNSDRRPMGQKPEGPKSEKVQLIDHRRAYNCEIMLSKVKVPMQELLSSILALEDSALDVDQVDNFIKFCPTKEEMELLKGYKGEKDKLGKCELFFLELMQVPRVEHKLRVFSFKIQFRTQVSELRTSLNVVNSASDQIKDSAKLKKIMQTILQLGNALNQGTARGSAVGFRLDSLLKLTETRARNNKMTLMHYLCKVLSDKLPDVLDFSNDLSSLEPASKVQLKFLAEEMQAINKGLEKIVQELSMSENDGPVSVKFRKALKEFLCFAEGEVRSLASLYSRVGRNVDSLIVYFGEDPARCPFEQVITTLLNFVRMFKQANEENLKQQEVEKKKAEKEASDKLKANPSEKPKADASGKQSSEKLKPSDTGQPLKHPTGIMK